MNDPVHVDMAREHPADLAALPVDTETITESVRLVLAPRSGLPTAEQLEEWLPVLRGHLALLVPVVQDQHPPAPGARQEIYAARRTLNVAPGHRLADVYMHVQVLAQHVRVLLRLATTDPAAPLPVDRLAIGSLVCTVMAPRTAVASPVLTAAWIGELTDHITSVLAALDLEAVASEQVRGVAADGRALIEHHYGPTSPVDAYLHARALAMILRILAEAHRQTADGGADSPRR